MRVTADTNIYIGALNYPGPPRTFLRLAATGDIRLALSNQIMEEIVETLSRKFRWPEGRIAEARTALTGITERVMPTVILNVVKDDPDDNKILECAQTSNSDYVVTGDKDLLRLRQYDGTPIITVSQFLGEFQRRTQARG